MNTFEGIRKCVICGSPERVEANHVGGQNHIGWFTRVLKCILVFTWMVLEGFQHSVRNRKRQHERGA